MSTKTARLRALLASGEFLYMPSATSGTDTARATSPATLTCSSIVSSGSVIARDAPVA